MTLMELKQWMEENCGFSATYDFQESLRINVDRNRLHQYRYQFKRWGLSKVDGKVLRASGSERLFVQTAVKVVDWADMSKEDSQGSAVANSNRQDEHFSHGIALPGKNPDPNSGSHDLNSAMRKTLQTAAELYLVLGCFEDAHRLYKQIWALLDRVPCLTPETLNILAATLSSFKGPECYDATTPSSFNGPKCNDAATEYSNLLNKPGKGVDIEVLHFVKTMLGYGAHITRFNNSLACVCQSLRMLRKESVENAISKLSPNDRSLDFLVYHCSMQFLSLYSSRIRNEDEPSNSQQEYFKMGSFYLKRLEPKTECRQNAQTSTTKVGQKLISQLRESFFLLNPGPFGFQGGSCLLSSLKWCRVQFESESKFSSFAVQVDYDMVRSSLILFLWEMWQRNNDLVASLQVEQRMGLSPVSFLEIAVDMILIYNPQLTHVNVFDWQTICLSVCQSLGDLLSMQYSELVQAFLKSIEPDKPRRSQGNLNKEKKTHIRNHAMDLIKEYTQLPTTESLHRPRLKAMQPIWPPDRMIRQPSSRASIHPVNSKFSPMSSISPSSSSLASMRRLRDLIKEGKYRLSPPSRKTDTPIGEQLSQMSERLGFLSVSPLREKAVEVNEKGLVRTGKCVPTAILTPVSVSRTLTGETVDVMETDSEVKEDRLCQASSTTVRTDDNKYFEMDIIKEGWYGQGW